ncbi:hypothetical protein PsorP6_016527 [Peronosclerospora sorghi]|uniref:Uncharacterized protein n=1 Tax=Peronosclerospora sorghi TaxID=230839 RepID=A0ACC0VQX0_9STRA|nr:hypothetical protein PsorP6_016527 [Peronosclerospora sorghi]
MKIVPVQKKTTAGQRTRFKAFVSVEDCNGHLGLGVKYAKEVDTAIRGDIIMGNISLVPVRRGYWVRNFVNATFYALRATYTYLTPDIWEKHAFGPSPYQEHTDFLAKTAIKNKFLNSVRERSCSQSIR